MTAQPRDAYFFRSRRGLPPELVEQQLKITELARSYGLDPIDVVFEMCDYDEINMIAAYGGFPVRYPHWRWGMEYLRMQKGYEWGLQKIYEMVINTAPSYAYLLDNNTFMDQKLVMAHVMGHVDFFTHNAWFTPTNKKMLDQMANHAARVRRYVDRFGSDEVEGFIDSCLSIENLIDPYREHIRRERTPRQEERVLAEQGDGVQKLPARSYMDKYINPPEELEAQRQRHQQALDAMKRFPDQPVRDVMGFVLRYGRMARWQQDVLGIIRDEAYYFAPQGQTKIMNEGWASYWHTTMMTRDLLTDAELIDYADHHSGTTVMQPGQLNPYKLGLELFRHIEERWNKGQFGLDWARTDDARLRREWDTGAGLGREKLFEVRRVHNDVTFVDTFLTEDFVEKVGLFATEYDRRSKTWKVASREFKAVKQQLLGMLASRGNPRISVTDGNHANRGELELTHSHDGIDIQLQWASTSLGHLCRLWGRPVHLVTEVDGERTVLHHDGSELTVEGAGKGALAQKQSA